MSVGQTATLIYLTNSEASAASGVHIAGREQTNSLKSNLGVLFPEEKKSAPERPARFVILRSEGEDFFIPRKFLRMTRIILGGNKVEYPRLSSFTKDTM